MPGSSRVDWYAQNRQLPGYIYICPRSIFEAKRVMPAGHASGGAEYDHVLVTHSAAPLVLLPALACYDRCGARKSTNQADRLQTVFPAFGSCLASAHCVSGRPMRSAHSTCDLDPCYIRGSDVLGAAPRGIGQLNADGSMDPLFWVLTVPVSNRKRLVTAAGRPGREDFGQHVLWAAMNSPLGNFAMQAKAVARAER